MSLRTIIAKPSAALARCMRAVNVHDRVMVPLTIVLGVVWVFVLNDGNIDFINFYDYATGGLFFLSIYAFGRIGFFLLSLGLRPPDSVPVAAQSANQPLIEVVVSYRNRSRRLKLASRFILLAIFISILTGMYVFAYADLVAKLSSPQAQLQRIAESVDSRSRFRSPFDKPSEDEQATRKAILDAIHEEGERLRAVKSEATPTEIVASTLSTRVGIMLLVIFLVQILVSLYRYNTKLAALYDSRGDALQLAATSLSFDEIVRITSVDGLDFAKQEKVLMDYVADVAKTVVEKFADKR